MEKQTQGTPSTKRVLATSVIVDVFNLLLSITVAAVTGSAIMLVAAIEGFAGLCSAGILLLSNRRGSKRATKLHPFGYGRELYYWSTVAAFVVVGITASVAFRIGYGHLLDASPLRYSFLIYIALTASLGTNLYSCWLSTRRMLDGQPITHLYRIFMDSPLIAAKTTVVLDAMGSSVAFLGLVFASLYGTTGTLPLDAVGAMMMGAILATAALLLLISVRSLVTGQSASKELERRIRDAAREVPEVKHILAMRTLMVGSDKLLVNIDVHFKDGLHTDQVEEAVAKVKAAVEACGDAEGMRVHVEPDPLEEHFHHKRI
jgi:cation diffusion facilitator family transporter